ncbi:MAG: hypothetical protein ACXACH_01680 [Candidatus Hermodarchaeia archaeon]
MESSNEEQLDVQSQDPNMETGNDILEPHVKWTRRTSLMVVADLIIKPFLAVFITVSFIFLVWMGNALLYGLDPSQLFVNPGMDSMTVQHIRALWGLDLPLPAQYGFFLFNLYTGRMYTTISFLTYSSIAEMIAERFLNSLLLILVPFLIITGVFTVFYWKQKDSYKESRGWRQYLYLVLFSKSFWLVLALGSYLLIFYLMIIGILPPGHTISPPGSIPNNPFAYVLDVAWHLVGPATILALLSMAVATHYFRQNPGQPIPPLSHGLSRLFLWIVIISIPLESIFIWFGTGRLLTFSIFARDFPVLLVIALTYLVTFGLTSVLLEGILRWGIYRHPIELHGLSVIPIQKSTFRKIPVIIGIVFLFSLVGVAVAGSLLFTSSWVWPVDPFQASLATLLPTLIDGFTIGFVVTLVGGVIGLVAYILLRINRRWLVKYLFTFLVSLLVIILFIQPLLPTITLSLYVSVTWAVALILSVGIIRKISNSPLGSGRTLLVNWAKTLLPLFFLYSLVGFLLTLVLGFLNVGFVQDNLGRVINALMQTGLIFVHITNLVIPGVLVGFGIITFEILWIGMQHTPLEKPPK